jgi:uncharacterized protein YegP (UPF0339 family)
VATATQKYRTAGRLARRAREMRAPESMEFLIVEDNGGDYHWTIVAGDGATLARSGSFASYDDAGKAAQHVRDGAASARFEWRAGEANPVDPAAPVDLNARRGATSDDSDAERWLDESGGFSSEAVAEWQAPR